MKMKKIPEKIVRKCRKRGLFLRLIHATSSGYDPFDFSTEKYLGACNECGKITFVDFWGCCANCKKIPQKVRI